MQQNLSENEAIIKLQMEQTMQKLDVLKIECDRCTKDYEFLKQLQIFLAKGFTFSLLQLLDKMDSLKQVGIFNSELISVLNEIRIVASSEAISKMNKFPALFEEACKLNSIEFDWASRYPKYNFYEGFLRLEIIESKGLARLSYTEGLLGEVPADIELIVELILRQFKRLFKRPFDEKRFLKKIRNQYLAILKRENAPDGSDIQIRKITTRLGHNEDRFRNDEFIVDIYRLLKSKNVDIDGRRLSFQQTKDTSKGMFIPGEFGGYIGFVHFALSELKESQ